MAVGLGKDQRFRHFVTVREKLREKAFLEGTDHRADLAGIDHIPIHRGSSIVQILVHLLPALGTGQTVTVFDLLLHDVCAVFGDVRLDQEDILAHVDAVDDGLLAGIFADHVLVEKGESALVRCGSQADEEGVKILQNLIPHVIDRPMAFIDDDAIEEFGRIFFIVDDLFCRLRVRAALFEEGFFLCRFVHLLALEDRIHALDRADADLDIIRDIGAVQATNSVKL